MCEHQKLRKLSPTHHHHHHQRHHRHHHHHHHRHHLLILCLRPPTTPTSSSRVLTRSMGKIFDGEKFRGGGIVKFNSVLERKCKSRKWNFLRARVKNSRKQEIFQEIPGWHFWFRARFFPFPFLISHLSEQLRLFSQATAIVPWCCWLHYSMHVGVTSSVEHTVV